MVVSIRSKPKNAKLYNRVKSQAKKKFNVYPSAYANAWVVYRYKNLGGKYSSKKTQYLNKSLFRIKKKKTKSGKYGRSSRH